MKTIRKRTNQNEYIYFTVYVNKKNAKGHTEVYRLPTLAYLRYEALGYGKAFFDFRPQDKKALPGAYKVNKITYTNDKAQYHTTKGIFTLPKYLDEKLPSKEYIFYSERVARK